MLTRKRKRELKELIPRLPLELWMMVGEVAGPEAWRSLTLTIPNMGRYSLNEKVQIRMKNMFLKKSTKMKRGILGHFYQIISHRLPNGELHNPLNNSDEEEKAAYMKYKKIEGVDVLVIKKWYKDGQKHREDGPARIKYHENGDKYEEGWYKNRKKHREGEPAEIAYYDHEIKMREAWYKDGKRHRDDGPAVSWYDVNGSISGKGEHAAQAWYKNGEEILFLFGMEVPRKRTQN